MAPLQVLTARAPRAVRHGFAVGDLRRGRDHDSRAGNLGAPTQVEVFAKHRDERVETAQGRKQVGAHERYSPGRDEDVALEVLLAVVNLANYDAFLDHTKAVRGLAHVQQHHRVLVGHHLGADDAGVRAKGGFHHLLNGVVFQSHVIVTKEEERRAFDHQCGFVAGGSESLVFLESPKERSRRDRGDSRGDVLGLPVRHYEQA